MQMLPVESSFNAALSNVDATETCRAHISGLGPRPAIVLIGAWGVGKSWFVETQVNSIAREVNSRFLHISVNGIADEQRIYDDIIDAFDAHNARKRNWIARSWSWTWGKISKHWHRGAAIGAGYAGITDSEVQSAINAVAISSKRKGAIARLRSAHSTLVIDDVERRKMPYELLFAAISKLVSIETCRVILVCSENSLKDELELTAYLDGKEKCCSITIQINTECESFISASIESLQPVETRRFATEQKAYLHRLVQATPDLSLRQVRAALMLFAIGDEALALEVGMVCQDKGLAIGSEIFYRLRHQSFRCVLMLLIESRRTKRSPSDLAKVIRRQTEYLLRTEKHKDERALFEEVADRYFDGREGIDAIPDYIIQLVERGRTDRAVLRSEIEKLITSSSDPGETALLALRGHSLMTKENAQAESELTSALATIALGRVTALDDFLHAATKLNYFADSGLTRESPDVIRQTIFEAIDETPFIVTTDYDGQLSDYNEEIPFHRNLHAALIKRSRHLLHKNAELHISQSFCEGGIVSAAAIAGNRDGAYFRLPLLSAIAPSDFWQHYPQLTNQQRDSLYTALRFRLKYSAMYPALTHERSWIQESVAILENQKGDERSVAAYHLKQMIAILADALQRIPLPPSIDQQMESEVR